ncbi:hypothetical protein [Streptomyces sp. NPDC000618]|uniref:DUF6924 domain-containing protein n=1 Tax=Streptomyces sp. NPDC000618 TaxID=3154265 RepID=UPI00332B4E52
MPLPQPEDLTSLVLRVDFDDDTAWEALRTAVEALDGGPHATWVSDPRYEGVGIPELMREDNAADEDEQLSSRFLADAHAMAGAEHSLPASPTAPTPQACSVGSGTVEADVQLPSSASRSVVSEAGSGV